MNQTINELPMFWKLFAFALLLLGIVFVFGFIGRYVTKLPWSSSEEGRHLIAMSANVGLFLLLYTALAVWPDMPYKNVVRMTLFAALIANCGWRWWLLEKHLRERRQSGLNSTDATER